VLRAHQEQASDEANALDTKKDSVMSAVVNCTCFCGAKSCVASHLIVSFSSYNGAM
jgi:hypothetical protein